MEEQGPPVPTHFAFAGAGVAAFLDASLWTWTGNRQTNRMRGLYLASVLAQDIAFFDTSATGTGGMLQVGGEVGRLFPRRMLRPGAPLL